MMAPSASGSREDPKRGTGRKGRAMDINTTTKAPLSFRVGKLLIRKGVRGGYRMLILAKRFGLLRSMVDVPLLNGYRMAVPIDRDENQWDREDLLQYEEELVSAVARAAADLPGPIVLVDCGADIGTLSVLLAMRVGRIAKVLAIEPNADVFEILRHNISRLPVPGEAVCAAVADFNGRGRLDLPEHNVRSEHARFLAPDPDGAFPVMRVDELPLQGFESVILKIDVEGGEAAVIAGAIRTIAKAAGVVITLEAHPEQVRRTGIDPMAVLRRLASVRPFEFRVCEDPGARLDLERPFFAQIDDGRIYNLLCKSVS